MGKRIVITELPIAVSLEQLHTRCHQRRARVLTTSSPQ